MRLNQLLATVLVALGSVLAAEAQPTLLFQPASRSVSPGANVLFQTVAYAETPITYQWFKSGSALAGETDDALFLTAVQSPDAADYVVVATATSGSVTSDVATLTIDGRFTKITAGPLVTDPGNSLPAAWGDYDNDGFPDVFVPKGATDFNYLYHNHGDGTFTRVAVAGVTTDYLNTRNAVWADYDNDGRVDLFVANSSLGGGGGFGGGGTTNILYHNNGDGTFTKSGGGELLFDTGQFTSAAWGDADGDGLLDLYVGVNGNPNLLYRNLGNGAFAKLDGDPSVLDTRKGTTSVAWGDYNNDGAPDLIVADQGGGGGFFALNANEFLYANRGTGTFTRQTNVITTAGGTSLSCAWVDYDNNGTLDLFVVNYAGQNNALFRNLGDGTFTNITTGELVTDGAEDGNSTGCAWGDFDNDGWMDVFVANDGGLGNLLYHNNGDGTFTKIETGSPANDLGNSTGCAWVDMDRDGFLDLFVSNVSGGNFLYHNNGNGNRWLDVRLVGDISNRSGIGAKVRLLATIGGDSFWQLREIGARDGSGSPHTPEAHFGLGDATVVQTLRIEWPSGIVQELHDVAPGQLLTVHELPSIRIASASVMEGDQGPRPLVFTLSLTQPTNAPVTVDYFTVDREAAAGIDYVATNGTVVFAPNQTTQTLAITVLGDLEDETNETFLVVLTNSTVLPITSRQAVGTIIDDEPLTMTVGNVSATESSGVALVPLTLLKPVDYDVAVDFATVQGTLGFIALAGLDYVHTNGTLHFAPGQTHAFLPVALLDDALDEQTETVSVYFTNVVNAVLVNSHADVFILDDDLPPTVSLRDVSMPEGDTDTTPMVFEARLSAPSANIVTVRYATSNLTAQAGIDYTFALGVLTFQPGVTSQTFSVDSIGDTTIEPDRRFLVNLYNPNLVTLGANGIGTILDDDFRATAVSRTSSGLRFTFPSSPSAHYRVEWTANLLPTPLWTPLDGYQSITAVGTSTEVLDPAALHDPQRFYRVVWLSP
jgi:hypothetical protein